MSITVNVNGFAGVPDGTLVVPTTKISLIRWGLVSARPWWIADPSLGRWTDWTAPPASLAEFSATELLELRRVAVLLNAYLHEDALGTPIETTEHFHALERTEQEEATARLDAAVAGQLAWSLLDVPALHHVGWTAPNLGIAPGPGARRPDYAGLDGGDPARWVVLTAAGLGAVEGGTVVPRTTAIDGRPVAASGAVVALPGEAGGQLDAYLEQPEGEGDPATALPDLDPDRLEEHRYAPFARAIATGMPTRSIGITAPLGSAATVRLFPLGLTGFVGLTEDVAGLVDDALAAPPEGRRPRFASAVRQLVRVRAEGANRTGGVKTIAARSRRKPPITSTQVVIEGVLHDLSVGPDGIALLLPSSVVRAHADRAYPVAHAA